MGDENVPRRSPDGDALHARLCKATERKERAHLWVPSDAITFVPRVLPVIYGDGRALFALATTNQRPAYWIIRGCSSWDAGNDRVAAEGPHFSELTDDILTDLEEAFGNGRCGYSGNSLFWPKRERMRDCKCEECSEQGVARWPMVDGSGGCGWSRMDWPAEFATIPNPLNWRGNLLELANPPPGPEAGDA